jgi:hypothetical protein
MKEEEFGDTKGLIRIHISKKNINTVISKYNTTTSAFTDNCVQ